MISILIPSRNEKFLTRTIQDLLEKCQGSIEIIVVLDGYWEQPVPDDRVHYIHRGRSMGMRAGINAAAALAKGEYLLKIDAHCMVDHGFDVKMQAVFDRQDMVVIPRRKRLDADKWQLEIQENKPDVDYEYLSAPIDAQDWGGAGLHGKQWNQRSVDRLADTKYLVDENMSFQGSCWMMRREYFYFLDLMDEESYGTFASEAQEIGLKCFLSGGVVVTNKKTWYAHLHKGKTHGRGYHLSKGDLGKANEFVNKWLTNEAGWPKQTLPFSSLIERFTDEKGNPPPTWPKDWKTRFPGIDSLPIPKA